MATPIGTSTRGGSTKFNPGPSNLHATDFCLSVRLSCLMVHDMVDAKTILCCTKDDMLSEYIVCGFAVIRHLFCGFAVFRLFFRGFVVSATPITLPQLGVGSYIFVYSYSQGTSRRM